MMGYIKGEVYYEVTFADRDLRYPNIQTYVFVGESYDEANRKVFCFQYSERFAGMGSIFNENAVDKIVILKSKDELAEMFDLDKLIAALRAAAARRQISNG